MTGGEGAWHEDDPNVPATERRRSESHAGIASPGLTAAATILLALAGAAAIADWWSVATDNRRLEYVAKPATLLLLAAVALTLDPADGAQRGWFVAALALSLAGDVFLMLPRDLFVPGLASFLLGHLAYVVGLNIVGGEASGLAVGSLLVTAAVLTLGVRIIRAVRRSDEPALVGPVGFYVLAISAMVVSAFGTLNGAAVAGAVLFYASDALIAERRFVAERPWHDLGVIVTYHLGQGLLVVSLL